jgi:hypothetical protein
MENAEIPADDHLLLLKRNPSTSIFASPAAGLRVERTHCFHTGCKYSPVHYLCGPQVQPAPAKDRMGLLVIKTISSKRGKVRVNGDFLGMIGLVRTG